jgi:hypothetical protein
VPIPASCDADRLREPPGRCSGCWLHDGEVAGCAVEIFVLVISGWGDDGARAIGANEMMMMRPLRRRRLTAISYGVDGADTPDRKPR